MSSHLSAPALARMLGPWQSGTGPAYRELADVVRLLVLDGRVSLDCALPGERPLAETLGISRTTVTAAYAQLREQGFLSSGQGAKGRTRLPQSVEAAAPGINAPDGILDLAYAALPASGEQVHRAFASALTELPALLPGFGYEVQGLRALREAIAERYTAAGVPTSAEEILVTSGAQHALNVILRALVVRTGGKQDKVLIDHPSYPNALDAIRAVGARAVPVALPGSSRNWDIDAWEGALEQHRPTIAYVIPDFHNPTGRLMPDQQRRRLVRAAARAGTVLIADETLRELNLDGLSSLPMAAFGRGVVSVGSLSKSHWGGLRTGWIHAEPELLNRFAAARSSMDLGGPVMEQLAAAHLVRELDQLLPERLDALRANRAALLDLLAAELPDWKTEMPDGGLSVWCRLPGPISTALTVIAPEFGIRLAAGPRFGVGGSYESHLRIPFTLPPEKLRTAVLALRAAQERLSSAPKLRRNLDDSPTAPVNAIA
ncbi:PLP-dependent aminotransferase family protein [Pseudarthrobacter sp. J64]|uniref:MocR-like transcription factor YczR n=1 Tax=Pseudarthrobacter sp. J64 TaxID=3116485 RepID=UPI002E7FD78F|nr:PLP-dependent aminotransferase family protein [Pseudarthrobacter sp. J64]MEE2570972.1 PLP-dependent aminotransferase family protein [Pseudarthrobacter sp. J64]